MAIAYSPLPNPDAYESEDGPLVKPANEYTPYKAQSVSRRSIFSIYILCGLTVLFALKTAPFALLSVPYFVHLCFDKLSFLHRWCGFLVWLLATLHTVFWSIQLAIDRRPSTGEMGFIYAWQYEKFIFAWIVSYFSDIFRFQKNSHQNLDRLTPVSPFS